MARYRSVVIGLLLLLSAFSGPSYSQSTWKLDPQKHLAQMANHMATVINNTIYTIGGTAYYWTPKSTPGSTVSTNNNTVYLLQTSNSFLRALDLSKPVNFEAEFSDTTEVISELPFEIPHVKVGAFWADQDILYYWGGQLEVLPVYMNGTFQNKTRDWPDPMTYYTYDLSQPKGSGVWRTRSLLSLSDSDLLITSPSLGSYSYSPEARKAFYMGGAVFRDRVGNPDGSSATWPETVKSYGVKSMVVYDAVKQTWKNQSSSLPAGLEDVVDGGMVYFAGVGKKGILVRIGGGKAAGSYIGFLTADVYDIDTGSWYRQQTTSKVTSFPVPRIFGFCTGAASAPDGTSFTIYIYGGLQDNTPPKGTWALTMPSFQWIPLATTDEPTLVRYSTTCQTVGRHIAMVRGRSSGDPWTDKVRDRGDEDGGTYFFDMTKLTWSLKYEPSEYQVPEEIYKIIGGNGQGGANKTGPADGTTLHPELHKLFAAAVKSTNSPNAATNSPGSSTNSRNPKSPAGSGKAGGGGSASVGAIVGGIIGARAALAIIGVGIGIWMLLRRRHQIPDNTMEARDLAELEDTHDP